MFAALLLTQRAGAHPQHQRNHRDQRQLQHQRPVEFRPERHREQQAAQDHCQQGGSLPVDARRRFAASFRHVATAQGQYQQANRHVDKERVSPAQPGDIRRHQPAAAHLADDKRNSADAAKQTDGFGVGRAFQGDVQRGEDLRHDQRRACALQYASAQQLLHASRHAAQQRCRAKGGHAPHKQTAAAKVIAKLTAQRETDGEGHAVQRHNQLQFGGRGVQ
ncbi:hypothetical protein D3C72_1041610 [compost metagenome]